MVHGGTKLWQFSHYWIPQGSIFWDPRIVLLGPLLILSSRAFMPMIPKLLFPSKHLIRIYIVHSVYCIAADHKCMVRRVVMAPRRLPTECRGMLLWEFWDFWRLLWSSLGRWTLPGILLLSFDEQGMSPDWCLTFHLAEVPKPIHFGHSARAGCSHFSITSELNLLHHLSRGFGGM